MKQPGCIAIDLTPVLPGGDNGGAKIMTIELIRQLAALQPACRFVLLTASVSHDELAYLDAPNVRRVIARQDASPSRSKIERLGNRALGILPAAIRSRLGYLYLKFSRKSSGLLSDLKADLLFCPFTAPFFHDAAVPTVSVIYDLQFKTYPQFFSPEENYHRNRHLLETCSVASEVVCISDYVKSTVLAQQIIEPEHLHTVHIQMPHRLPKPDRQVVDATLRRFDLSKNGFLLYPANFWSHKNHEMLLTAFGMFRAGNPDSQLKLVCTGAPGKRQQSLIESARMMGLGAMTLFPGYLTDEEFSALLSECRGVIFPSLYEGFGMPVVEAMAAGKPVACSNVASLPEIAGDAAILFNPKRPAEIVAAIERIATCDARLDSLVAAGHARANQLGDSKKMAQQYWGIFQQALAKSTPASRNSVRGIYPDGWCGGKVSLTFGEAEGERTLELALFAPPWLARQSISVRITAGSSREKHRLKRGERLALKMAIAPGQDALELEISPVFQPKRAGISEDERELACMIEKCTLHDASGANSIDFLAQEFSS